MTTPTPPPNPHIRRPRRYRITAGVAAGVLAVVLAGCGGNTASPASSPTDTSAGTDGGATEQILPVDANPITNTATTQGFTIDSVLVENNEDGSGNAVDDHLEIAVTNTTTAELSGFEVFYTYADPTTNVTESYYTELPASFTIAAGASRVIHFDNTGAPDHFAVNQFSLYYLDANALDVTVEVSAVGAAPQTTTVQKDAGGAEVPD